MAFTPFYLIAGGTGSADINAGSTIGAAVVGATTNGNWNSGTGVFISTGTPFGPATAGDYAAIYVDGATVTPFVAKILSVDSTAQITVDVATIKYGTAPSTSATARSCVVGGSWNTEQVLAAGGLASTTVPQSTKINIKGNLTITASRTISMAGSATNALWFSGYNTNPGDLDADTTNSLAKPIWTFNSTFLLTTSGANQLWSSLSLVGTRSGNIWQSQGSSHIAVRCRVENLSANAAAIAMTNATGAQSWHYCWFKTPTTATTTGTVSVGIFTTFIGCVFEGGGLAGANIGALAPQFTHCIFLNNTGAGILASTGRALVYGCTFYNASVDGIKWTGAPPGASVIVGCLFDTMTNGVNNASGTNTTMVQMACNDFCSTVTNSIVGFGDSFAFFPQTDTGSQVTSSTDMTPIAGSNALANGFPGIFEKQSFSDYLDIGAVQRQSSGGGGFVGIIGG